MSDTFKNEKKVSLPERVKSLRATLGWSQSELARQFGVTHAAVARWETGENTLSGPALKLLEIFERKAESFEKQD